MGALNVYLDASALVPLFLLDPFVEQIRAFLRSHSTVLCVSDFAAAEFSSVVARRVRIKLLSSDEARQAFLNFDNWATATFRVETFSADIRAADAIVRRLDLALRTPDALHIAIAQRIGAELATFDEKMAASARALGTPLAAL